MESLKDAGERINVSKKAKEYKHHIVGGKLHREYEEGPLKGEKIIKE